MLGCGSNNRVVKFNIGFLECTHLSHRMSVYNHSEMLCFSGCILKASSWKRSQPNKVVLKLWVVILWWQAAYFNLAGCDTNLNCFVSSPKKHLLGRLISEQNNRTQVSEVRKVKHRLHVRWYALSQVFIAENTLVVTKGNNTHSNLEIKPSWIPYFWKVATHRNTDRSGQRGQLCLRQLCPQH